MSDERLDEIFDELADSIGARERQELAADLALAADPVTPGEGVREQVMARITRAQRTRRSHALWRWRTGLGLAAAAGLGALVTYVALAPASSPPPALAEDRTGELDELEATIEAQDEEIAAMEADLGEARDALSVLTAERVERLDLAAAGGDGALARVYWDWDEYSCYFVATGLPAAEEQRIYALWLYTDEDEILLAGSFRAEASGSARFFAMLPREMGHVLRAVVTEETEPPGETPLGPVVLSGGAPPQPATG